MKVLDFHADDLLDREILGTLSDDDRSKLRERLRKVRLLSSRTPAAPGFRQ